ncbi:chlorophyllase [Dactylosporangium vinaceum]|uniref:Alpha/beta hydrolase family protein n=1 Tax=Dactylosporangium vinaceum TaxID=53362 RepID=A0ABV5M673_9ACTN|nr:chlorophyllase [Dactylosporangium vinaceum]UAB97777.1 chlorophyllase [Dactylosporangium vinaceum]
MRLLLVAACLVALTGCSTPAPARTAPAPATSPAVAASVAPSVVTQLAAVQLPAPLALPPSGLSVSSQEVTYRREGRTLRTIVWTPDRAGRYPAVLFSHGLNGSPEAFAPLLKSWAGAGFVVIAPAYPNTTRGAAKFDVYDVLNQPADAGFVLSQVLAGPLGKRIDADRLAAAGHSAGAITTVGLFTAARDARLRAGVILAGSGLGVGTAFSGTPAALFFVHGDADQLVPYASGRSTYDLVPWSKAMLTIPGGDHNAPFERPAATGAVLKFLRLELYGDAAARSAFTPTAQLDAHL